MINLKKEKTGTENNKLALKENPKFDIRLSALYTILTFRIPHGMLRGKRYIKNDVEIAGICTEIREKNTNFEACWYLLNIEGHNRAEGASSITEYRRTVRLLEPGFKL